ncbi:MAG TPA: phosphatase PAP2 family protein [Bacillota bacterium]
MNGLLIAIARFDTFINQWVIALRSDWLTWLMLRITSLGSAGGIIAVGLGGVAACCYFHKTVESVMLMLTVLGAFGISEGLKSLLQRARPPLPWLGPATGFSFPSGHSLVSMTLYGFLAYLVWRELRPSLRRRTLITVLIMLPALIGVSRIYLGVHYPSDVLGGWMLALLWTEICVTAMKYLNFQVYKRKGLN